MASPLKVSLTNIDTGEVKIFGSTIQASDFLGRSKIYVKMRFDKPDQIAYGKDGTQYRVALLGKGHRKDHNSYLRKPYNPDNAKYAGYKPAQKCYECARAVGFCSWSRKFEPVPGWTAKETKISHFKNRRGERVYVKDTDSYHITDCPLFLEEAKTTKERRKQRKMLMEELINK